MSEPRKCTITALMQYETSVYLNDARAVAQAALDECREQFIGPHSGFIEVAWTEYGEEPPHERPMRKRFEFLGARIK